MTPKQSQSPTDLEQEAARWVVRMHSDQVTIEDERAFARWIVESAAHRKEYDSQAATWASLGALSKDDEALKALSDLRAPVGRSLERRSMLAAAFAGALFLVAGGAAAWHSITSNQRYSTGLGEQQNIVLADGSQVTLNTDTTLRVELDGGERRVWLDHGQAFFTVAHDRKRPFRVFAGGGEARAIGTAFDVRQDDTLTKVTLTEGSLAVFASAEKSTRRAPDALLTPGQQAELTHSKVLRVANVDVSHISAWRFGQMIFDSAPLSDVVNEINRYNARKLVLAEPALAQIAVNGVFRTSNPDAFAEALTEAFPIDVSSEDQHTIRLRRRSAR